MIDEFCLPHLLLLDTANELIVEKRYFRRVAFALPFFGSWHMEYHARQKTGCHRQAGCYIGSLPERLA